MDNRLNIVFMLPKEIADYATGLCRKVMEDHEVSFSLDAVNNFPHITIYQLVIPDKNRAKLIEVLGLTVAKISPQKLEFIGFQEHFGFLGASFKPSEDIKAAQREIVETVTTLREGKNVLEVDDPRTEGWPESHKKIVAEYGFDNLFDFYNPHITITRLPDFAKAKQLTEELTWPFSEFESNSIGLYSLGEFGTCNKLIREFKLGAAN